MSDLTEKLQRYRKMFSDAENDIEYWKQCVEMYSEITSALIRENERMKAVVDAATELERIYTNTSYVSDDELLVALEQPLENLFARLMTPDPSP